LSERARSDGCVFRSRPVPLDSASEILFSGDAGDTQAIQPSRRYGIEWIGAFATGSMKAAHQIAKGTELQRSSKPCGRVPTSQHNSFGDRGGIEIFRFSILLGTVLILVLAIRRFSGQE
jgi:hypothetical protein